MVVGSRAHVPWLRAHLLATVEDYAVVHGLVEEVFSAGIGATVKAETRDLFRRPRR